MAALVVRMRSVNMSVIFIGLVVEMRPLINPCLSNEISMG
jgi:hypothetical protein